MTDAARIYLTATAFVIVYAAPAGAFAECEVVNDGEAIRCDAGDAKVLRDKARAFGLFCSQLPSEVVATHLSSELAALCEDVSHVSGIYADAKTKRKHAEAADEAQREANQAKGRVAELRVELDDEKEKRVAAEKKVTAWKFVSGGLGALALGLLVTVGVDAAGMVDVGKPQ